jgi:nucleotide sugar dehydrogenase
VQEVARGIGLDNRIGTKFLHAGPGFGGSCFPKDTRALIKTAQDYEAPIRIVEAVLAVNENRKRAMARKVASILGGSLRGKTVALLGLTFKPNADDMRESPSIPLISALQDLGATIRAYDQIRKRGQTDAVGRLEPRDCCHQSGMNAPVRSGVFTRGDGSATEDFLEEPRIP